uniref:PHD-type domain-containing protein n=1 Tax=Trichobilharzia regenti TaxID=157069 RepID=A0AA85JMH7_TRIRE|nr:unnamed protein product [Trichobilharzia regenti]
MAPTNNCGRPDCHFPVDDGMQCDNCSLWFHKVCTGLTPVAYKRCCKPSSPWLCKFCSNPLDVLIQEAVGLLMSKKLSKDIVEKPVPETFAKDGGSGHSCKIQGASPPEVSEAKEAQNAQTSVAAKRKRQRKSRRASSASMAKPACEIATPKRSVSSARMASSRGENRVGETDSTWLLPKGKKLNKTRKETVAEFTNKVSTTVSSSKTQKPTDSSYSIIIWNLEESKNTDPAARHADDLKAISSIFREILPEKTTGVHVRKAIRIGKRNPDATGTPRRLLKVVLGNETERRTILDNAFKVNDKSLKIRPDWPLEDRIKRREAVAELKARLEKGEKDLKLLGFRVVRSRKPMLPRPLFISRVNT